MLSFTTTTLADALKHMKKMGAASMKLVLRDRQDRPLSALILIEGKQESAEAVAAFDKLSDAWSDGRPSCSVVEWKTTANEMPDCDTTVMIATHAEEDTHYAYHDGEIWRYAGSALPVLGTVYAWADVPAAPKKGKA